MAYPRVVDDLKTCAKLGVPSRVPVLGLGLEFDMEMAGVDYRDYITNPETMVQVQVRASERFDYDWALLHPDDYIELEPLGIETIASADSPPAALNKLPADRETLRNLRLPDPAHAGRMPAHLDGLAGTKSAFGDSLCVGGRVAGPFSAVTLVYGMGEGLVLMLDDAELFRATSEFFVEMMTMWGIAQLDAGADVIWLGDCVAASGFLSPQHYADFALEPAARVSDALRDHGGTVIYHTGDADLRYAEAAADHFEIINLGEGIDMAQAKASIGDRVCLCGNADPIEMMNCDDMAEVEGEIARIVEAGKPGGGYMFNTGEGIPRQTLPEVVETMIDTARRHGSY